MTIYRFLFVASKPILSKQFPNVSSESDLQRYRTAQQSNERKSPSLSNPTDSVKQKVCPQVCTTFFLPNLYRWYILRPKLN